MVSRPRTRGSSQADENGAHTGELAPTGAEITPTSPSGSTGPSARAHGRGFIRLDKTFSLYMVYIGDVELNPFVPAFGSRPACLAGRDDLLSDFEDAFDGLSGVAGYTYLFSGQRGMGKTVLLDYYAAAAAQAGWVTIAESSSPGLVQRLACDRIPRRLAELSDRSREITSAGGGLGPVSASVSWQDRYPAESTLRSQLEGLTELMAEQGAGVVITVDEVHAAEVEELRQLAEVIQHARREDRPVAFAAAGLSTPIRYLLDHEGTTFLRRAEHVTVQAVSDEAVREALVATVQAGGRDIDDDAVEMAVRAIGGYPFLLQLVGHRAWKRAVGDLTVGDVEVGIAEAQRRLGRNVHAPALRPLSAVDRTFLLAMACDDGPSRTSDVAVRMGVNAQYAGVYRRRLIEDGIIEPIGRGFVRFTIPYLAEYLRQEAAHDALAEMAGPTDDSGDDES